jgi:hypothetical protein
VVEPNQVDVTAYLLRELDAKVAEVIPEIDARAGAELPIRSLVEQTWTALQHPLPVDAEGSWLTVGVEAVSLAPLREQAGALIASLGLDARPRVGIGPPPQAAPEPLPSLGEEQAEQALLALVVLELGREGAQRRLQRAVGLVDAQGLPTPERGLRFPDQGAPYLQVRELEVLAVAPQLRVRLGFEGSGKGTLYAVGTPIAELEHQRLHFPNLDFELHTGHVLLRLLDWQQHQGLRDKLRSKLQWDLGDKLEELRANLEGALTRSAGGVQLSARIGQVRMLSLLEQEGDERLLALFRFAEEAEAEP